MAGLRFGRAIISTVDLGSSDNGQDATPSLLPDPSPEDPSSAGVVLTLGIASAFDYVQDTSGSFGAIYSLLQYPSQYPALQDPTSLTVGVPNIPSWVDAIGATATPVSSTVFTIANSDGSTTEVHGTGFTYNGSTLTGGNITGLFRIDTGGNIDEQVLLGSTVVTADSFMAQVTGAGKFSLVFAGDDVFNDTLAYGNSLGVTVEGWEFGAFLNGFAGTNTEQLFDRGLSVTFNVNLSTGGSGYVTEWTPGRVLSPIGSDILSNIQNVTVVTSDFVEIYAGDDADNNSFTAAPGPCGLLSYASSVHAVTVDFATRQAFGSDIGIDTFAYFSGASGGNGDDLFLAFADNYVYGGNGFNILEELSRGVTLNLDLNSGVYLFQEIVLSGGDNTVTASASTTWSVYLYGAAGNDTLTTGVAGGYLIDNAGGNNTLNGGGGTNVFLGGGASHNTMNGGSGVNVYYTTANDTIHGAGTFNIDILLTGNVNLAMGSSGVQEVVLNSGTNTLDMTGSGQFVYLYGGAGDDTMTTGAGGGYLFGEGGTNLLTGGGGLNVFVADSGAGADTMNGGSGSNVYFIDDNSVVHGAGTFNTVIELQQNASLTLGSTQLGTDVQQVVLSGGDNTVDFHTATSSVYLYGAAGNDTLFGGTGNDFLSGGAGANTFTFATGWGQDIIEDWTAGTGNQIDLTALSGLGVHGIADLTQTIVNGSDVITSTHTGTNSITLLGVGAALSTSSFHFA